jgi:LysR family nitrogen assimilation transcriptional regulator
MTDWEEWRVEIRRLRYFMRVAEGGSLTKAAGMLRIAQSALSRQMRLLEEDLGVPLFDRTARGMRLTAQGENLRGSVAGPLREMELALQNVRSLSSQIEATLAIGLPPGLADILAQPLAMALRAALPNIRFSLVEGPTGSLIDWLNRGVIDCALLEETARNHQLREQRLATLPLALIGPDAGAFPQDYRPPLAEILALPLILPSHHLGIRAAVADAALAHQLNISTVMEADSPRLITSLVAAAMGYGILPIAYCARQARAGGIGIWPVSQPELSIDIFLCSRKGSESGGRLFGAALDLVTAIVTSQLRAADDGHHSDRI